MSVYHQLPRRAYRHLEGPLGPLGPISRRAHFIIEQSALRFDRRYGPGRRIPIGRGEVGTLLGVRIIESPL